MYKIKDDVNLALMKRIGVITVNERNLYRDVQGYIWKKGITPTDFFYDKIKASTYHAGENPILNYRKDGNLILAKKDSDAIFLYSENQVLSPTQFINFFVSLYDATRNASLELERSIYADFGLEDLNINFADIILATGATPEFMEEYDSNFKKVGDSKNIYGSELNGVKTIYSSQDESCIYSYSSQYGMSVVSFLDSMIELNPDIRLLMSNTAITPYRSTLVETFLDTLKNNYREFANCTPMEIADKMDSWIKAGRKFEDRKQEEFFEAFGREKEAVNYRISQSNSSYRVFPALRYVLKSQEKDEEIKYTDSKYVLKWYEGDPDNGPRAINHALGIISNTMSSEREPNIIACRNMQEVKDYMNEVQKKAIEINGRLKKKEDKNKENK